MPEDNDGRNAARGNYEVETKPASELTNKEIVNEARQLHDRFQQLAERYESGTAGQKAEVREEMRPVVERERELRAEYTGRLQPEVTRDRVPDTPQIGLGF
jgi:hypothetical protein